MLVAMCCSTYYSYIGIYNSVNSPVRFLQESYVQIEEELTGSYDAGLEECIGLAVEEVNDAASMVTARYTQLSEERENMEACRGALAEEGESYAEGMRAPKQSAYEKYEDYVAAYETYVAGMSAGSNTEEAALRTGILASYGFASVEALQKAEADNAAELSSLCAALGITLSDEDGAVLREVSDINVNLLNSLNEAMQGQAFDTVDSRSLNRLFQAAKICGYEGSTAADIIHTVKSVAEITGEPLMEEYTALVAVLEGGSVTAANTMDLKNAMDSEILEALLKVNSILPKEEQISYADVRYHITDLYLVPISAWKDASTQMTAFFCFGVAALTDILSVLFAVSLRKRKPVWKRKYLLLCNLEDYAPQIYASLPSILQPVQALAEFISYFEPSPETECDGYMMCAGMSELNAYCSLVALLCQINLAKIVPEGFVKGNQETEREILLLKARFVFWLNSVIYEGKPVGEEVSA